MLYFFPTYVRVILGWFSDKENIFKQLQCKDILGMDREIVFVLKELEIFENMKDEPLPETHEEFEARAILYHILMDLEDFLIYKRRFVDGLDDVQRKLYWEKE